MMDLLCDELIINISKYLDAKTLHAFSICSGKFLFLLYEKNLWLSHFNNLEICNCGLDITKCITPYIRSYKHKSNIDTNIFNNLSNTASPFKAYTYYRPKTCNYIYTRGKIKGHKCMKICQAMNKFCLHHKHNRNSYV